MVKKKMALLMTAYKHNKLTIQQTQAQAFKGHFGTWTQRCQ